MQCSSEHDRMHKSAMLLPTALHSVLHKSTNAELHSLVCRFDAEVRKIKGVAAWPILWVTNSQSVSTSSVSTQFFPFIVFPFNVFLFYIFLFFYILGSTPGTGSMFQLFNFQTCKSEIIPKLSWRPEYGVSVRG